MGSLSLLSPWGLALAALVGPLVLLYVLKIKRRRQRVASTWLWARARRDLMARSPFQKLVTQVPLILEGGALLLAALAFARPVSRSEGALGGHVALVVDVSASMSASSSEHGPTRLDQAKKRAHELVRTMAPGTEVMVVTAGRSAKVASPLDRDTRRVESAIDGVAVEETEGDLGAAVGLAVDRLRELPGARMVVLTDGALARDAGLEASAVPIDVELVGEKVDNLGIVKVDVRSSVDRKARTESTQAFLLLENSGEIDRDVYLTMREENASDVIASRRVLVKKHEKLPVVLEFASTAGDRGRGLLFDVSPHDGMPADDVAFGRVPEGQKIPVLLASKSGSPWLERALASDPDIELDKIDPAALGKSGSTAHALTVTDGFCPDGTPAGDLVVVHPPEGTCQGVRVGTTIEGPVVTSWDDGDPRLRFLALDGVSISKANKLEVDGDRRALVRAHDGVLVADASSASRSATVIGFDVGESDWPLKAGFVVFVRNLVEEARNHRARAAVKPARTGEPLLVPVPSSVAMVEVSRPGMESVSMPARGGLAVIPDTTRPGLYRVSYTGPEAGTLVVPVNLVSEAESDLSRSLSPHATGAVTVRAEGDHPIAHREHAFWLALLALILLVADVVWLTRGGSRSTRRRPVMLAASALSLLVPLWSLLVFARVIPDAYLRLARPIAAPLVPAAVILIAYRLMRSERRWGRVREALHDMVIGTAAIALGLAVTGLEVGRPLDRLTVVVAMDRSRSIDLVPGGDILIERNIELATSKMREGDRIGTVAFGAAARSEDPPHPKNVAASAQRASVGRDATDLEAAIRRALAEVPSDSAARIELLSDGVATRGDTLSAAAAALAAEVPVDVITLEQREVPDLRIVSVRGPARGNEGEWIDLRVTTSSPRDAEVNVTVKRDGEVVARSKTTVVGGEDVLKIRQKLPSGGLHRFEVEVSAVDGSLDFSADDNAGSSFVRVRGEASALVLEGDRGKSRFVADALRAASFRVEEGGVADVPIDLAGLARFDLVVLSDIPASSLSPGQIESIASYVRDFGGGLLLMGGDRSLGPGGYGKTPIEEISPVAFDLKQEERRASLAEVIGIDISGSMGAEVGNKTKLDLANEAAARSAALLGPGDNLGVEHVDTAVHWSVPLGPITDPAKIERAIRSATVGGGGIIVPITLQEGYAALDALKGEKKVNLKHLLLFADGGDAEEIEHALPLAGPAKAHGITTSVVALGAGKDVAQLEELSRIGGGRFYLIEDASRLPAVFAQETILAARSALSEEPFRVAVGTRSPAIEGIDFAQAPSLAGYVVTIPKPRASVHLTGPEGDPILAIWPAGIGRSGVFTSDLKDRWGVGWTSWPGAARMVVQIARDLARKQENDQVRLESDASGGQLRLRATATGDDGRADAFRRLKVHVSGPDGFSRELALDPTGPGLYAADVPLSRAGTYLATAVDEATGESEGVTGSVLTSGDELRPTGSDAALLAQVARFTGGRVRDTLEGVFEDRSARRLAYDDIARALIVAGAIALLLHVAIRRVSLPEQLLPLPPRPPRRTVKALDARTERARATMSALLAARSGARASAASSRIEEASAGGNPLGVEPTPAPAPPRNQAVASSEKSLATVSPEIRSTQESVAPHSLPSTNPDPPQKLSSVELLAAKKKRRRE